MRGPCTRSDLSGDPPAATGLYLYVRLITVGESVKCFHIHFIVRFGHRGYAIGIVAELEVGSQI